MLIHISQPGESLHAIAVNYAITPSLLAIVNPNIKSPMLHPGEIINLPNHGDTYNHQCQSVFSTNQQYNDGMLYTLSARLDEKLFISLYQTNLSGSDIILNYQSGYRHDFIICDHMSRRLFKWSKDKCFGQFRGSRILKPGETYCQGADFPFIDKLPNLVNIYAWDTAEELNSRVMHLVFNR